MFLIEYKEWYMFVENNVMQQQGHAGDDVHLNEWPSVQYSFSHNIIFIVYMF